MVKLLKYTNHIIKMFTFILLYKLEIKLQKKRTLIKTHKFPS